MISVCTQAPALQFGVPVGNLLAALTSIRSATHSVTRSTGYRHHGHAAHPAMASTQDPMASTQLTHGVRQTLTELGLGDIASSVRVEICDRLLCQPLPEMTTTRFTEFHNSTDSFFENKHGFREVELWKDRSRLKFSISLPNLGSSSQGHSSQTRWLSENCLLQLHRGFKTRRSIDYRSVPLKFGGEKERSGVTSADKSEEALLTAAKGDLPPKLKALLGEHDAASDVQGKLKAAFADGYIAGHEGPKETAGGSSWSKYAKNFLIGVAIVVVLMLPINMIMGAMSRSPQLSQLLGPKYHEIMPEDIDVKFDDVKGIDEAKEELEDVVEFLKNPDKFQSLGAKLPKGVLLCGPPGIGKTMLARAVAGEASVPFFQVSGSEFDEMFVGVGAKRIRALFDEAKAAAPCVIFLDEIDAVGSKRTSSEIHPYANQTINQLLTEMDGFKQNEGVIVIGATNRRDNLDKALLRPGRFDVEVRVYLPDFKGRVEILQHYITKVKTAGHLDVDKLAHSTVGCSGADLANLVNQAAIKACLVQDQVVTNAHLEFAKDKLLMGPAKKSKIPDEETNKVTACHEAGHALVAYHTKDAISPHKVTIMPRGMSLGHTSFVPEKERYNMTRAQLLAEMDVAMGGRVAEEIIYGVDKVTTGAGSDFEKATHIAESLVKRYGMSEKAGYRIIHDKDYQFGAEINEYSAGTLETVDAEIKRLLSESYERARALLRSHHKELTVMSDALMFYETLDSDDIKLLISGKKLKKDFDKLNSSSRTLGRESSPSASAIKAIIEGTILPAQPPTNPQTQKQINPKAQRTL